MHRNDIELVNAAKKDPRAYEALYRKYADRVFNYFWYRTGHNRELAEDLMQETFLRAFRDLPRFRHRGYEYLTYLLKIAHHLLIDYYRKPKMLPLDEVGEVPYEIIQDFERKSDAETLWRAMQSLPERQRDILLMHYQENMAVKEIARVLGSSENAVKLHLSRARKRLAGHAHLKDIRAFLDARRDYTRPKFLGR